MSEQTTIVRVEQTTPRNCGQACLAMVLGIPIDEVPKEASSEHWDAEAVQAWLASWGLQEIRVRLDNEQTLWPAHAVRCIVDGKSPRGEKLHAIVCRMEGPQGFVVEADPHPDQSGLDGEPHSVAFFAVKDPAAFVRERERLLDLLHRDKTGLAAALDEARRVAKGWAWIEESRGPYEWDDKEYQQEAGRMVRAVIEACDKGLELSGNLAHAECCGRQPRRTIVDEQADQIAGLREELAAVGRLAELIFNQTEDAIARDAAREILASCGGRP